MWLPHSKIIPVLLLTLLPGVRAQLQVGDPLPQRVVWEDALGPDAPVLEGRVVLLDFWASWCAPCKASFPMMAQLHRDFSTDGLVILAVGLDAQAPAYHAFLKQMAPPFVALHDQHRRLAKIFKVPAMPSSYLFDRAGRLRGIHRGYHGRATDIALRREIEELLNEKQ